MPLRTAFGFLLCLALHPFSSPAIDWPQWRGRNRDGKSTDKGLLEEWPTSGPPLAFRASGLGRGFPSVSIADGRLYFRYQDGLVVLVDATPGGIVRLVPYSRGRKSELASSGRVGRKAIPARAGSAVRLRRPATVTSLQRP